MLGAWSKRQARSVASFFADVVIVILGVFLGLQAQNWASDRADRARGAHFIDRIDTDFAAILRDARICTRVSEKSVNAIERIRSVLEEFGQGEEITPAGELEVWLVEMTASVMPPGRSSAYVEMISAGELGLLDSEAMREALVRYDQEALTNRDVWLLLREMFNPVMPVFFRHVTVRKGSSTDGTEISEYDLAGLAADPDVFVGLSTMAAVAANAYQLCTSQEEAARAVVGLLPG